MALAVAETARRSFEQGELVQDALPSRPVRIDRLAAGIPVFQLFVEAGLCASNGEARRLIRGGGARINDRPATDESALVGEDDLLDGAIKLSLGRKQHVLLRPEPGVD